MVLCGCNFMLKALDTLGNYSKKLLAKKTNLVTSNGELLMVFCEKRLPLK